MTVHQLVGQYYPSDQEQLLQQIQKLESLIIENHKETIKELNKIRCENDQIKQWLLHLESTATTPIASPATSSSSSDPISNATEPEPKSEIFSRSAVTSTRKAPAIPSSPFPVLRSMTRTYKANKKLRTRHQIPSFASSSSSSDSSDEKGPEQEETRSDVEDPSSNESYVPEKDDGSSDSSLDTDDSELHPHTQRDAAALSSQLSIITRSQVKFGRGRPRKQVTEDEEEVQPRKKTATARRGTRTSLRRNSQEAILTENEVDEAGNDGDIPIYNLNKEITSVKDVWREWTDGVTDDEPAVKELEKQYGDSWRKDKDNNNLFLKVRLPIINEINLMMRYGKDTTDVDAVRRLDAHRMGKALNLADLAKRIKAHSIISQERGVAPVPFID